MTQDTAVSPATEPGPHPHAGVARATIAAVVFDAGRVLITLDKRRIAENFARHSPLSVDAIEAEIVHGDLGIALELGEIDSHEHFRLLKEKIKGAPEWRYEEFSQEFRAGFTLPPRSIEALRFAATRARVFIMSNTSYLHALWMFEQEVLATLPEQLFFSFREGIMKPDPRLWDIFFERTGLRAERVLYFDDIDENCRTATALGVHAVHFDIAHGDLLAHLKTWLD